MPADAPWDVNADVSLPAKEVPAEEQQQVSIVVPEKYRVDEDAIAIWSQDEFGRTTITFDASAHRKQIVADYYGDHLTGEEPEPTETDS